MQDEGMGKGVDTSARHTFTKERQPRGMSKLSYHQPDQSDYNSNIKLPVILNGLKAKAEELLAEEQAGYRPGRSTVE